jgi:hypothetical protein
MASKRVSNQTAEQVAAHLKSALGGDSFDVEMDSFTGVARVTKSSGGQGHSSKLERMKNNMSGMSPKQRRTAMSAKRREKPKLKHVRNGRAITLKGYTPYKQEPKPGTDSKASPGYWRGPQSLHEQA